MAIRIVGEGFQQFVPLMANPSSAPNTGMGLFYNHKLRTGTRELAEPFLRFDIVEADDGDRILFEEGSVGWQSPLKTGSGSGLDDRCLKKKLGPQLLFPLITKMRRTDNRKTLDFSPIEKFSSDQTGFNRFSHSYIVRDEKANGIELECHEKRHQLVGPGFEAQVPDAPERSGSRPKLKAHGVPKEKSRILAP